MSVDLQTVAAATSAADRIVLHNCRLAGAGVDVFGRDAVRAMLAAARFSAGARTVIASHVAALFDNTGRALFADVYGDYVARLWLLAPESVGSAAADRTDTPFDPDLDQRGGSIAFDAADYPDLDADDASRIVHAAMDWLRPTGPAGLTRLRPVVLRACSNGHSAAALIAVNGRRTDAPGQVRFNVGVLLHRGSEAITIVDEAGLAAELAREWRPGL